MVQAEPGGFSAWLELGHVLRRQSEYEAMLAAYRQALAVAPQRWEALLSMARGLEEAGQFEMAALAYHRAVLLGGAAAQAGTAPAAEGPSPVQLPPTPH